MYEEGEPVEGFDLDVKAKLKHRRKQTPNETDAERWEVIYRLLFPGESIPSPFFEPPQDEPPPSPTRPIKGFIRHEVTGLIRSQIEEKFSTSENFELTPEALSTSMEALIKQATDASIQMFYSERDGRIVKGKGQIIESAGPSLILAETGSRSLAPEQPTKFIQEESYTSSFLTMGHDQLDSTSDPSQISSEPILVLDLIIPVGKTATTPNPGLGDLLKNMQEVRKLEDTSTPPNKGKRRAVDPPEVLCTNDKILVDQEIPLGYLKFSTTTSPTQKTSSTTRCFNKKPARILRTLYSVPEWNLSGRRSGVWHCPC